MPDTSVTKTKKLPTFDTHRFNLLDLPVEIIFRFFEHLSI